MKTCVLYFSRTGNTKLMAEAIATSLNLPLFDMTKTDPTELEGFNTLILGTPVEGFSPAKETLTYVQRLTATEEGKAILFCTYTLWTGRTFGKLSGELSQKGYHTILKVSKKKVQPGITDFSDAVKEISEKIPATKP